MQGGRCASFQKPLKNHPMVRAKITGTRSGQVAPACSFRPRLGETGFLPATKNLHPHFFATTYEPKEVERSEKPFCDEKSASREGDRGPLAQRAALKGQKSNLAMT